MTSFFEGYSFIAQIPEGSWDIQIIERKKSADILGKPLKLRKIDFYPSRKKTDYFVQQIYYSLALFIFYTSFYF